MFYATFISTRLKKVIGNRGKMGIYKDRNDLKEYLTINDLMIATGIKDITLRTYLCHYSISPYMLKGRAYKLKRSKNAIQALINYLIKKKKLSVSSKKNLYELVNNI